MQRRDFLAAGAAALTPALWPRNLFARPADEPSVCCGTKYASPQEAIKSQPEKLLYATALYVGTPVNKPDYLATVDVDPASPTYSQVVRRAAMPHAGDELHHFGWNACSSCHADEDKHRRYLIVPGLKSSRIHVLDAADPRAP